MLCGMVNIPFPHERSILSFAIDDEDRIGFLTSLQHIHEAVFAHRNGRSISQFPAHSRRFDLELRLFEWEPRASSNEGSKRLRLFLQGGRFVGCLTEHEQARKWQ